MLKIVVFHKYWLRVPQKSHLVANADIRKCWKSLRDLILTIIGIWDIVCALVLMSRI